MHLRALCSVGKVYGESDERAFRRGNETKSWTGRVADGGWKIKLERKREV